MYSNLRKFRGLATNYLYCQKKIMLKIGITGGIGSGKTTVCKIFAHLNIPVYYADDRAKWLMVNDPDLKKKIQRIIGREAYHDDGQLNRAHIGNLVFNNPAMLKALNQAVHPAVYSDGENWFDKQTGPYAIKEAALFYETGSHHTVDKMIVVAAPREVRIERVMKRDNVTRKAVEARMDKQLPQAEKVKHADFVIYNDGNKFLIPQVLEIHRELILNV